jgi:hypothetical protein
LVPLGPEQISIQTYVLKVVVVSGTSGSNPLCSSGEQLANFEKLTGQMVESTRNETGVLACQRFVSDDRQIVHVYERYENSAAAIAHLEKMRWTPKMRRIG